MSGSKSAALGLITVAYIVCIAAAAAVLVWITLPQPWNAFAADVAATVVIFAFSRKYRNSSFYDAYWSVIPPLLAVYWTTPTSAPMSIRCAPRWCWAWSGCGRFA